MTRSASAFAAGSGGDGRAGLQNNIVAATINEPPTATVMALTRNAVATLLDLHLAVNQRRGRTRSKKRPLPASSKLRRVFLTVAGGGFTALSSD
jgi:hypothetical protein